MPNHCINELIFRGVDRAARDKIMTAACNSRGSVDFDVLVPTPLNMWWGNVGSDHEKAFKRTALDWSREHWGTKWNAYDIRPVEEADDTLTLRFETAWAPPYPWLAALFNSLKLSFDHNWLSEGGGDGVHGEFRIEGRWGPEWKEAAADPELHRHLHKLLWGVEEFEEEDAQGIEARSDETPQAAQPEGQEPGPEGMRP